MSNTNEQSKDLTAKILPCGGYAIFGIDQKSKNRIQIGYVGPNLNKDAFLPKDIKIEK